ncbi:MAG TPA: potassium-transporting ATPase subunit KdpC [Polyangiales bacterium]|nr:potassium-transporting ATPase subunit KdpC [Polyangiales bacterium]
MRHLRPAILLCAFFVVVTGLAFPVAVWAIAQVAFPHQAEGSLLRDGQGRVIGSALIGQSFVRPGYFHPRPSAAGSGYDAASSGGTNFGPISDKLVNGSDGLRELARAYRERNGLESNAAIPADAATRSGSGLDPDISPENAQLQAARVARARGLPEAHVRQLVARHTRGRTLGLLGEPRVNVLELNLALDARQ